MSAILLIGYGNPGRGDDGLGPALAERIQSSRPQDLTVDSDYQLTVEHAFDLVEYDTVIFADAAMTGAEPFSFRPLQPSSPQSFTTHSLAPEAVLYLAETLFQANTRGFLLAIRGYEFGLFRESLSDAAERNLEVARAFVLGLKTGHRRTAQELVQSRDRTIA